MGGCVSRDMSRYPIEQSSSSDNDSKKVFDVIRSQNRRSDISSTKARGELSQSHDNLEAALESFNNAFHTTINDKGEGKFEVDSESIGGYRTGGVFRNMIDIEEGKINGLANWRFAGEWHLSDVVFHQILRVLHEKEMNISQFDPKCWEGNNIANSSTKEILDEVGEGTFYPNSRQFRRLLNSEIGSSKKYFLEAHFPHKQIIHIITNLNNENTFDVMFVFGNR